MVMPECGAYHLRNLLLVSVNELVYNLFLYLMNLIFSLFHVLLQTMFYALTRRTSAKVASCRPRVYADLLKDDDSSITQQVERAKPSKVGFRCNDEILKRLWDDHKQPYYEDYSKRSVVQSILNVNGTWDAHSDVRKFGGDCNTALTANIKFLLLFFSFVVQYVCIHL